MKTKNFLGKSMLCCCLFVIFALSGYAQCVNSSQFGSATAINDGDPHVISGCNYYGEYSNFTSAIIGDDYEFTLEGGGYITVTDTSNNVLGHGSAPYVWTATTSSVRLHWNGDGVSCATDSSCHDTGYTNLSYVAPPAPGNDLCVDAIGLECGSVESGNTDTATDSDIPGFCGTSITSVGVWYKFEGNGADISLTTCSPNTDYDTKLAVYEGNCGSLVCVEGDDDAGSANCVHSSLHSLVEFSSEVGTTYYIYVSGFTNFSGVDRTGNFDISLTCKVRVDIAESCTTVYDGYDPLACTDISATATFGTPPYTYSWSNGAMGETINVCPTETTTYEVTVTDAVGDTDTAETIVIVTNVDCSNNANNGKVTICHVSSDGSTNTICVSENAVESHLEHGDSIGTCGDTFTCDTSPSCALVVSPANGAVDQTIDSEVSWIAAEGLVAGYLVSIGTTSGGTDIADNIDVGDNLSYVPGNLEYLTTYYVTVTPYNGNGNAEGCDESSFTTEESPWCSADALECNTVKSGSTVGLDSGSGIETCGTSLNDVPGQWYSFVGTGDEYSITTCSPNTDFDTKLGVFVGDCNSISCVAGDDDDPSCTNDSLQSLVEFVSVPGETYYVFVTGFNSFSNGPQTGNYDLTITCIEPPAPAPDPINDIDCASGSNSYSYCYNSNDLFSWLFSSSDTSPVTLSFNAGTIELNTFSGGTYDDMVIYDGSDETGVVLFDSDVAEPATLAGLSFVGTSGNLYITFDSDFSVSCDSGSQESWEFDVSCGLSERMAVSKTPKTGKLNTAHDWTIFPNPAKDMVDLNLSQLNISRAQVEVFDYTGKILKNLDVNVELLPKVNIDLQGLNAGVYFIRVISESETSVKRLIIR